MACREILKNAGDVTVSINWCDRR